MEKEGRGDVIGDKDIFATGHTTPVAFWSEILGEMP